MKSIDALADSIKTAAPASDPAPDLSKMSDALVNKIAEAVIAKLSAATQAEVADDPADDKTDVDEGGEDNADGQPDEVG